MLSVPDLRAAQGVNLVTRKPTHIRCRSLDIARSRYHSLSLSRSVTLLSHTRSLFEAVHKLAGPRLLEECLKVKADPVLGACISFVYYYYCVVLTTSVCIRISSIFVVWCVSGNTFCIEGINSNLNLKP